MGEQEIDWHRQQAMDAMRRRRVYAESELGTLPPPPQLAALYAVMVGNEEELDEILEEMPFHDLGRLAVHCERLKRVVMCKRQERLQAPHEG